jgi:ribosomal protein S18 acetylase RimI-like enzyme
MARAERAPIRIRRARRADADALTRLAHASKRHWRYPEQLIRLWRRDLTVAPDALVRLPAYCAVRGSRVVGFYAVSGGRGTRELDHLWVRPASIGSGVGRRLFAHLVRTMRARGASRLRIPSDPHAEGFYRRMGARRVGTIPSRPPGRRLPLLVLRLAPAGRRKGG